MSNSFNGSIAQKSVLFPIETVITPLNGANYTKALIFMPSSIAGTYLSGVSNVSTNVVYELKSTNYTSYVSGLLKTWLAPFFTSASAAIVGVCVYDDGDDATNTLSVCYTNWKMYAYFKFAFADDTTTYNSLNVELSTLCLDDSLYSDCWIGTNDSNVLSTSSSLITSLTTAKSNARVIYNPDTTINPALAQLGASLSYINTTGTPVGNSIDMVAFSTIGASGSTDADGNVTNLTATEYAALDTQKIGYQTWVGDGTSNVVTEGSLTLQGESVGANWVKHYIEYMCKTGAATIITKMNAFRNNTTYQSILTLVCDTVNKFVDMGRLDNFVLTAPVFADLPTSGDTLTVSDAWEADYIDNTRAVTVYGTLYLTSPTR